MSWDALQHSWGMTDQNAQNQQPSNPDGASAPWANPMDAPPPFPNVGSGRPLSGGNPYAHDANPYGQASQYSALPTSSYGHSRQPQVTGEDRLWAVLAHLSAPIAAVVSAGWLTFVGPLVVWAMKKDSSPFVRSASAGAFNFSVMMGLISIVGWILNLTVIFFFIGLPMVIIGALGAVVLGILGAIKVWNGASFTYPWQVKILG